MGIRTARRKPYEEAIRDGSLIITTNRFREVGPAGVADLIPRGENLYITFDIDVMDPSQAPGTGTPEIGGLFYHEVRECLEALVSKVQPGGVRYGGSCSALRLAELTVGLAARIVVDILAARFPSKVRLYLRPAGVPGGSLLVSVGRPE